MRIGRPENIEKTTGSLLLPLVVSTWATDKFQAAAQKAWDTLEEAEGNENARMQALVAGLTECEELRCDLTVGYGGSPDELGETTLDSLLMDGPEHRSGAVAAMQRVRQAAKVAWAVMNFTKHTLLVGEKATHFALSMGFQEQSLETEDSKKMHEKWLKNKCQPNFWKNVSPDPAPDVARISQIQLPLILVVVSQAGVNSFDSANHDTLGMIVIDADGHVSAGTSSNGARNKIPGRVGDSPIPGSDVMMRFSPSFLAVELMTNGHSPMEAALEAIKRIQKYYPHFFGAIVVAKRSGEYGAGCSGMDIFNYSLVQPTTGRVAVQNVTCVKLDQSSSDLFQLKVYSIMASQRVFPSLPRLKVPIGHVPQKLKTKGFENPQARIEILRRMVNKVVREERCEFKYNRAVECRQYVERLIQLGIYRGMNDDYTMEMMKWWLIEQDNLDKMVDILLPRFSEMQEPYTAIYQLPRMRVPAKVIGHKATHWNQYDIAVLELNGNPFPSLDPLQARRREMLKEIVKTQKLVRE
uniref:Large ribosomal subunit protein bL17m n=1 Tax=Ditylenchus dipsaci TaxID=166011 RepID=A0A915DDV0_9BILA